MEIARDRYLDPSRAYHLTLTLRSRTTEMHSMLTALSPDDRDALAAVLARALDEIGDLVGSRVPQ
ncbi:MAG: hypothetical protein ACT4QD_24080 [Acidobacteriota bacterium]